MGKQSLRQFLVALHRRAMAKIPLDGDGTTVWMTYDPGDESDGPLTASVRQAGMRAYVNWGKLYMRCAGDAFSGRSAFFPRATDQI